ncbi:MAG: helix-turn-helix transcriptional regulator [Lachnospiraceae bacterium]|jgi:transcriptional regulator with XRE-family HTH domain|uniref:Helix-turn-helix domain-containing protein n=1 Tax=Eubacterium ruminantium TaxID=42322 RepID=A0A1T4QDT1_9FIRM|nr:helix-turn-helix transcriptional regulator [Eubacterium ruminantium]MDD7702887.1 helix-turn-helix transcriptional regulator [Lachnospiraceae bacterium]SCW68989.1 Helix-turn-helix domain-containing protein [Eubacterium ruminantium]SDN37302.1 Helix-turn-helix domain-containing protein [Eubacterium ruminantium]SKA01855.1 Helix-turn-helix domain-containing protein [Eubacterium ruminantium]
MTGEFGKFIETKRKALNKTLRGLAADLDIAPAYMSDIEKGHRYPPDKDKLEKMAELLNLSEEEKNKMFDLAAGEKDNSVSPDLPEYIMGTEKARVALRMARDNGATDATWQKIIDMLEKENGE